ncbi:17428_t:CDS:2, partial [Racocetra persica]
EPLNGLINDPKEREMNLVIWESPEFIKCECLPNDDLVMVTDTDVYIWTFNTERIQLNYYYSEIEGRLSILDEVTFTDSFLPSPYITSVIHRRGYSFGIQEHFKELLETYTKEEFYLTIYGYDVMNAIVEFRDYKLAENFCTSCIKLNFKNEKDPTPNIQLFGIISQFISELTEENSIFVEGFISEISYFIAIDEYYLTQTLAKVTSVQHLDSLGVHNQLTTLSNVDIFMRKFFSNFGTYLNQLFETRLINIKKFYDKHFIDNKIPVILTFPLPKYVDYPKEYNFCQELIRPKPNYPSYSSDPNDPWNLATTYNSITSNNTIETSASLIEPPDSNTNMFMWFDSSILAVYIMLT